MAESADIPFSEKRRTAGQLAGDLAADLTGFGYNPIDFHPEAKWPRRREEALLMETAGLLEGIRHGYVVNGQPRIRENLLDLIEDVPESLAQSVTRKLTQILYLAAMHGFTAENQPQRVASRSRMPG